MTDILDNLCAIGNVVETVVVLHQAGVGRHHHSINVQMVIDYPFPLLRYDHLSVRIKVVVPVGDRRTILKHQLICPVDIAVTDILDNLCAIGNVVETAVVLH